MYNHADYRLMSKRALDALALDAEVNLFLRGMVPLVGYKSTTVGYSRHERLAGKSHYPLSKMVSLAIAGITSMSIKPIRIISVFGFIVSFVSFIAVIWAIVSFFCWKSCCRLGEHGFAALLFVGRSNNEHRRYWRVRRQNLS